MSATRRADAPLRAWRQAARRACFGCAALTLALAGGGPAKAASATAEPANIPPAVRPAYGADAPSIFLPYLNGPGAAGPLMDRPKLGLSAGGKSIPALVDTGSTGVGLSKSLIPGFATLPHLGRGQLVYNGSGRVLRGVYVRVSVTLTGADGTRFVTRDMPVLAVDELACLWTSGACQPRRNPKDIAILGVGFARGGDFAAPATNPLLEAPDMGAPGAPGAMRRGYLVSRAGLRIGLDAAHTAGFGFLKLGAGTGGSQWAPAPACITLNDAAPACGRMLMDTGSGGMFLRLPATPANGPRIPLPPGARIAVRAPGLPDFLYAVRIGDTANPLTPKRALLTGPPNPSAFVNTSFHLLNGFDYLYDADGGFVGFRPAP